MYAKVLRKQFEIKEGVIIHTPTGAEFTPIKGTPGSLLVWTRFIGSMLQNGERYRYTDVLAVMKTISGQSLHTA